MKKPKIGNKIYLPSSLHVYRGEDDTAGGLATISKIEVKEDLPKNHFNRIFVGVSEIPRSMYNWRSLLEKQAVLKALYGDEVARPDPDDRPEFNQPNADWR